MMAELGHNYNIQCMKLFQELKAAYPATPDELVRQCMKAVSWKESRNTCNANPLALLPMPTLLLRTAQQTFFPKYIHNSQ